MIAQLTAVRDFPRHITRREAMWYRVDPCVEKTELRVWGHEGNKSSQERESQRQESQRERSREGCLLLYLRIRLRTDPRAPVKKLSKVRTRRLELLGTMTGGHTNPTSTGSHLPDWES